MKMGLLGAARKRALKARLALPKISFREDAPHAARNEIIDEILAQPQPGRKS